MTVKNISNLAASVQGRLQNHARATNRPFQELLQYYAMERFLNRMSQTPHARAHRRRRSTKDWSKHAKSKNASRRESLTGVGGTR